MGQTRRPNQYTVFDSAPISIFCLKNGRILQSNYAAERIYNLSSKDLINHFFTELIDEDDQESVKAYLDAIRKARSAEPEIVHRINQSSEANERWLELTAIALESDKGNTDADYDLLSGGCN